MSVPITAKILNRLGLIGSTGLATGSLVPQAQTPDAEANRIAEFNRAGKLGDPDTWSRYGDLIRRPATYESQLQLWSEMADWDLLTAALSEVVLEATQPDPGTGRVLWYECSDNPIESSLNEMLQRVQIDDIIGSQFWHVAALGNHFEKVEYSPGPSEGVLGLSYVPPIAIRRYWLERNRQCVGYRWMGQQPDKRDAFVQADGVTPVERVSLQSSDNTLEELWYPWDFMHLRRMFKLRVSEHGEPIFEEAQGVYKRLRMAIDQMAVCRANVQPDRYVVNVDVKDQPPAEHSKTIQRQKQMFRSKLAFGPGTGANAIGDPTKFDSFYSGLAMDTVLWVPKPTGFEHTITKLAGTANVPDVYDIDLLTNLFYSIIRMPRGWFNPGKENSSIASGKALLAQDMRFLRLIKTLRRAVISGYTWLGYLHCALRGVPLERLDIKTKMSPISSLDDALRTEILDAQAGVLDKLSDVMKKYNLPREAWIELVFKKYMHLPDELVYTFMTALPPETPTEESVGANPPRYSAIINEVVKELGGVREVQAIRAKAGCLSALVSDTGVVSPLRRVNEVLAAPTFVNGDRVRSDGDVQVFSGSQRVGPSGKVALSESASEAGSMRTRLVNATTVVLSRQDNSEGAKPSSDKNATGVQRAMRMYPPVPPA